MTWFNNSLPGYNYNYNHETTSKIRECEQINNPNLAYLSSNTSSSSLPITPITAFREGGTVYTNLRSTSFAMPTRGSNTGISYSSICMYKW